MNHGVNVETWNEEVVLNLLRHFLPSQAPLKDFVHHNTLHAFDDKVFDHAVHQASVMFGYRVYLSLQEYRALYKSHHIREDVLEDRIIRRVGEANADEWVHKLFHGDYKEDFTGRIGQLRLHWKKVYGIDPDAEVNGKLFKFLSAYMDQGVAAWHFAKGKKGFLKTMQELEKRSFRSFLRSDRCRKWLARQDHSLSELLKVLVGDEKYFIHYIFDQQFSHPGWSGMVAYLEGKPDALMDAKRVTLYDVIWFNLLLEIDMLDENLGADWKPLATNLTNEIPSLFAAVEEDELHKVLSIWQEAYEWSFFDQVLAGMVKNRMAHADKKNPVFQALFCIDDREGSIRRYIESACPQAETFGTPGHFGLDFYFQPEHGKFFSKVCPVPVKANYLIRELSPRFQVARDTHFDAKHLHPLWSLPKALLTGYYSALQLARNIFVPSAGAGASSSFAHMDKNGALTIEFQGEHEAHHQWQIGYTPLEMADRVEKVLRSIGLNQHFAPLVYVMGHGASSINNTHYAGYDCGACSGRPGSVNARVFSAMLNRSDVRLILANQGLVIPDTTQFLGGLHDTTRDEFLFFDVDLLSKENQVFHAQHLELFDSALKHNAMERGRKFFSVDLHQPLEQIYKEVQERSVSLFEPRPELNHATNCLCIVGRHSLHECLFLDRRAFSNSYDYRTDPRGDLLFSILSAATPVCGGINLEYYFSRVDNEKLGAGSKLSHNVVGLIGVCNGAEGDLRTGLPIQMVELHDPLRLMMVVEQYPEKVMEVLGRSEALLNWYSKRWMHLAVIHPEKQEVFVFNSSGFEPYTTLKHLIDSVRDISEIILSGEMVLPVIRIQQS